MRRLLIRPGAIGDCLLAFPALEFLRSDYTEVWTSSPLVPLVHFADIVRPIASTGIDLVGVGDLTIDTGLRDRLASFDSIVSWYGAARPEFRRALELIGVPCSFYPALPPPDFAGHAGDFFLSQVDAPIGPNPCVAVTPSSPRNAVVIHPFSGSKRKNWPLENFQHLAWDLNWPVEWTAGPEEQLAAATRFTSLGDLASWMSGARLYIGNDSGITHLAAAIGVPVIALFGPTAPEHWAPRGSNVHVLHQTPIESLPISAVIRLAEGLLTHNTKTTLGF